MKYLVLGIILRLGIFILFSSKLEWSQLYNGDTLENCKSSGTLTLNDNFSNYMFIRIQLFYSSINTVFNVLTYPYVGNSNMRIYFSETQYINFIGSESYGTSFTFNINNTDIVVTNILGFIKK